MTDRVQVVDVVFDDATPYKPEGEEEEDASGAQDLGEPTEVLDVSSEALPIEVPGPSTGGCKPWTAKALSAAFDSSNFKSENSDELLEVMLSVNKTLSDALLNKSRVSKTAASIAESEDKILPDNVLEEIVMRSLQRAREEQTALWDIYHEETEYYKNEGYNLPAFYYMRNFMFKERKLYQTYLKRKNRGFVFGLNAGFKIISTPVPPNSPDLTYNLRAPADTASNPLGPTSPQSSNSQENKEDPGLVDESTNDPSVLTTSESPNLREIKQEPDFFVETINDPLLPTSPVPLNSGEVKTEVDFVETTSTPSVVLNPVSHISRENKEGWVGSSNPLVLTIPVTQNPGEIPQGVPNVNNPLVLAIPVPQNSREMSQDFRVAVDTTTGSLVLASSLPHNPGEVPEGGGVFVEGGNNPLVFIRPAYKPPDPVDSTSDSSVFINSVSRVCPVSAKPCEDGLRHVKNFLKQEGARPSEITKRMVNVYGEQCRSIATDVSGNNAQNNGVGGNTEQQNDSKSAKNHHQDSPARPANWEVFRPAAADVLDNYVKRKERRKKTSPIDEFPSFFEAMAVMLRRFPKYKQNYIREQIFALVTNEEKYQIDLQENVPPNAEMS